VNGQNGRSERGNAGLVEDRSATEVLEDVSIPALQTEPLPEPATRAKQRAKQQFQPNRFIIVGAGAVVTALLIFVAVFMPHRSTPQKTKSLGGTKDLSSTDVINESDEKSLFPITDSGRPAAKDAQPGFLNEGDLQRTVIRSNANPSPAAQPKEAGTLASIPPFGDKWQEPPYPAGATAGAIDGDRAEREVMEKSSLMYVRKVSASAVASQAVNEAAPELGLGLATGTRLRAHLDSAASTAVQTPVLAVIEYNYEENGEIIIPAGAKAVGRVRAANRSGYVDLQFDSLLMPDGASVPIEAAGTGLDLRPLKGRVEGKNTGKNVLVRSLSGIGQAGSLFLGQGSLNQPLSESDLIRERLASNIGETGDEEVSRMAVNQQIVVTIPAGIPIYVVVQQTPKSSQPLGQAGPRNTSTSSSSNTDQLRQILQLQQELNQSSAANNPSSQ
jgi:Bacterial conjugation TrbI-like protein